MPRGAPFQSVDELALVLGVTPEIFARIRPALTVYSQQPGVDQRIAPKEALLAHPGMTERQADSILAERRSGFHSVNAQGVPLGAGVIDPSLALNGHAFTIVAAFTYRETAMRRQAVVRLNGDPARPYMTLGE